MRFFKTLVLITALHGLILYALIFHPYPELFIYPYLTNNGLTPYSQIFDQHFPGLMFLPLNLNNLGMVNEDIARVWLVVIVLLTQMLVYIITKKILDEKRAILACLLYLIWQPFFEGWVLWIDTFLPLLLLPAFYFTYQYLSLNVKRYLFYSGLFLGLALVFKQVIGPLIVLVGLLLLIYRRPIKDLLIFSLGIIPAPLLILVYYLSLGIIKDVWFWTVEFNLTTFAKYGRKPPFLSGLLRMGLVYLPIFLYPLFGDKQSLKARSKTMFSSFAYRKLGLTLLTFTSGSLFAAFARFDFVHLQPSLPFIVIGSSHILISLWQLPKLKLLVVGYILVTIWWLAAFYRGHIGTKVFFFDPQTKQVAQKINDYAESKERIYLFGPPAHLYQLSDTLPVGNVFVFQFPWFLMETEELFLKALQDHRPRLVVRDLTVEIEGSEITDFASKLHMFIDDHYEVVEKIGNNEFMRLKNE